MRRLEETMVTEIAPYLISGKFDVEKANKSSDLI